MYIDGIGNETTRKMRLYSMYVFILNKREGTLISGGRDMKKLSDSSKTSVIDPFFVE